MIKILLSTVISLLIILSIFTYAPKEQLDVFCKLLGYFSMGFIISEIMQRITGVK